MACRAVLFDIDGTLVDSNGLHVEAWVEAFAELGYAIDRAAIAGQIGKGPDNLVPDLIPDADPALAKKLGDRHGAIFKRKYLDRVKPFPAARDLVARVHQAGKTVVLASSSSKAELDHYVKLMDLDGLVDASTTIDDVKHSKPAPDIFVAGREKAGSPAEADVAVIGDSPWDMVPARYCGMRAIGVRSGGFADDALTAAGADAVYDDVAAVLAGFGESLIGR